MSHEGVKQTTSFNMTTKGDCSTIDMLTNDNRITFQNNSANIPIDHSAATMASPRLLSSLILLQMFYAQIVMAYKSKLSKCARNKYVRWCYVIYKIVGCYVLTFALL